MRKTIILIFVLLFVLAINDKVFAQEQEFVQAKVLDQKTGEPIVFATIRLIGKAKGVITNMDGGFRLPTVYREEGLSIEISFMGYEKMETPLQALSTNEITIFYLSPAVFTLTEAVIRAKKKENPQPRLLLNVP